MVEQEREQREELVALLRGAINELSKGELGEEDAIKAMCIAVQQIAKALDLIDPIIVEDYEEEEEA